MNMVLIRNGRIFLQRLAVVVGFLFSLLVSVYVVYLVAEKFFFDKFFYQKSVKHGYRTMDWEKSYDDYGARGRDLSDFWKKVNSNYKRDVLGENLEDDLFTIVAIGDSYVWGQGVRFEDTVTQVLEKKLGKISPTKIISLGDSGDAIVDYLGRYEAAKEIYTADLYIFFLVQNDLLLNCDNRLGRYDRFDIVEACEKDFSDDNVVFDWKNGELWKKNMELARKSKVNLCVMGRTIMELPKEKSIYFITDDYDGNNENFVVYRELLGEYDRYIVSSERSKYYDRYRKFWNDPYDSFRISKTEEHPSSWAHKMYADVLYEEITENQKFGFYR